MPNRFRVDLAYDGGDFEGWQVQPDRRTVQGELAGALARIGEEARPTGAGRTDAGVHALGQVAHVDLKRNWDPDELIRALRGMIPKDIHCLRVTPVPESFHARFSAETRTYHYALGLTHNPFFRNRRWVVGSFPDDHWAHGELQNLMGDNDFASFAKSGGGSSSTECQVHEATWTRFAEGAVLTLTANRFVYGMVRAVVGTLIRGASGTGSGEVFPQVLKAKDRGAAGEAAPPWGLYLATVCYPGQNRPTVEASEVASLAGLLGTATTTVPPGNES